MISGMLFGTWIGALYVMIGIFFGPTITFFLGRKYGKRLERKFISKKQADHFDDMYDRYGWYVLFF